MKKKSNYEAEITFVACYQKNIDGYVVEISISTNAALKQKVWLRLMSFIKKVPKDRRGMVWNAFYLYEEKKEQEAKNPLFDY